MSETLADRIASVLAEHDSGGGVARFGGDALMTDIRSALSEPSDSLDAAWQEVEAALPEGWAIYDLHGIRRIDSRTVVWQAVARRGGSAISGEGLDKIAALRALASALRSTGDKP